MLEISLLISSVCDDYRNYPVYFLLEVFKFVRAAINFLYTPRGVLIKRCVALYSVMVSISTKREDWNSIDPIRDVKYLADYILKEEARLSRTPEPVPKKGLDPELVAKLLPPDMQVYITVSLICMSYSTNMSHK